MTIPSHTRARSRASSLHWWAVAAAAVALAAPLPDEWRLTVQILTVVFGVVVLWVVRGRAARSIAAAVVVVVGAVVGVQIAGQVLALVFERSFIDDAVVVG